VLVNLQVFGSFGLIDASRRSLTKALKHQSVVIYVGGMAELFLSTPTEERLYIAKRTGMLLHNYTYITILYMLIQHVIMSATNACLQ
jgi:Diacylglycerol acyltransferase